jgi:hypothetical protein
LGSLINPGVGERCGFLIAVAQYVHFLCHCNKENEPKENASQTDASARSAGFYAACGVIRFWCPIPKAKPTFTPLPWPARSDIWANAFFILGRRPRR